MQAKFNESASGQQPELMLFGDPHGDFEPLVSAVQRLQPKAIILLGDMTSAKPLHIELAEIIEATNVWFIHGNHDTDREDYWLNISEHLVGTQLEGRNLHGRVADIGGKRVAGLGGIFRGAVWMPSPDCSIGEPKAVSWHMPDDLRRHHKPAERWRGGVSLKHRTTIFPSEVQAMAQMRADILVSHESPALPRAIQDTEPHLGFGVMRELADRMGVQLAVHGHHHEDIDYQEYPTLTPRAWSGYGVDQGSFLAVNF